MLPRWQDRVTRALAKSRGHNPSQHRKRAEKWIRVPLYTELREYAIASRGWRATLSTTGRFNCGRFPDRVELVIVRRRFA